MKSDGEQPGLVDFHRSGLRVSFSHQIFETDDDFFRADFTGTDCDCFSVKIKESGRKHLIVRAISAVVLGNKTLVHGDCGAYVFVGRVGKLY